MTHGSGPAVRTDQSNLTPAGLAYWPACTEEELSQHYARAVNDLDHEDLSMLAAWHATLEVGTPIASAEFLVAVFDALGNHRRDALKLAARFRGDEAFLANVGEKETLDIVLPWLSDERLEQLAGSALEIYVRDRAGTDC